MIISTTSGSHRQHALYIWDKATGSLVKMLTGQKGETLLDIVVGLLLRVLIYCCRCLHVSCNSSIPVFCRDLLEL